MRYKGIKINKAGSLTNLYLGKNGGCFNPFNSQIYLRSDVYHMFEWIFLDNYDKPKILRLIQLLEHEYKHLLQLRKLGLLKYILGCLPVYRFSRIETEALEVNKKVELKYKDFSKSQLKSLIIKNTGLG